MTTLLAFFNLSSTEILLILGAGVILFGRRLPEVGRYLGKGIVEFKKGIRGIEDEIDTQGSPGMFNAPEPPRPPQRIAQTGPKFEDASAEQSNKS